MAAHSVAFANSRPPFNSDWYITNELCIHMWSRFSGFSFMLDLTNDRPLMLKVIWKILHSVSKNGIYKKRNQNPCKDSKIWKITHITKQYPAWVGYVKPQKFDT